MIFLLIVYVILLILYSPAFTEGYFLIDDQTLIGNSFFQSSISILEKIKLVFKPHSQIDYYPIRDLSYLLDWLFSTNLENNLLPVKLQNLIWFCLTGFFIYKILCIHNKNWALILTSIWLLHPYHAESLFWASARKDLLANCFYVMTVFSLMVFHKNNQKTNKSEYDFKFILNFLVISSLNLLMNLSKATYLLFFPMLLILGVFYYGKDILKKINLFSVLVFNSGISLILALVQKWQYSSVNNMFFDYESNYRIKAILIALGKMSLGVIYFPINVIDCENWGEWVDFNFNYIYIGIFVTSAFLGFSFYSLKKKNWFYIICVFVVLSIYVLTPGPNILHRNFYSLRYFVPISIVLTIALNYFLKDKKKFKDFNIKYKLIFLFSFAVFIYSTWIESINWQTNESVMDKSVKQSEQQPNLIWNRALTYIDKMKWGKTTETENQLIKADLDKLRKVCSIDSVNEYRNGSLCMGFWAGSKQLNKTLKDFYTIPESEYNKNLDIYYIVTNKIANTNLIRPFDDQIIHSEKYQVYLMHKVDNSFMAREDLKAMYLIELCMANDYAKAQNQFTELSSLGLINKARFLTLISDLPNKNELLKIRNCLKF